MAGVLEYWSTGVLGKKVSLFFYHLAWTVFVILVLPSLPFIRRGRLIERLGLRFPAVPPMKRPIWIHALSVGEVLSSLPLVRALKKAYPDRDIAYSVTTPQGMKIARQELERDIRFLFTMPLDFWWAVKRVVDSLRPSFFILVETDLWPGLIHHLKKRGVAVLLVNGRISPRTLGAYLKCKYFVRMMLDFFEFCLMQSDHDRERILKLGVDKKRVITAGNIKFDREQVPMRSEERGAWMDALHLKPEEPLWVAGSTHEGEEEILLDALSDLRTVFPGMRLIIAPRKIERAEFIRNLANQRGFKTRLKTGLAGGDGGYDVLILDTIGELGRIYGIARISFVGGSLVPVGGHNLLEPAGFGRPVLFGPHMHNFVLMSQLLEESGGGQMVRDRGELVEAMKDLLCHPDKMTHMGEKAMDFVEINRGALARVMACIGPYL